MKLAVVLHDTARSLGETAPFLKLLFPFLAITGSLLFFRHGWMGIAKRRTWLFGRVQAGVLNRGSVTGWPAVFIGVCHVIAGALILALLAPISAAMWGLW